MRRVLLCLSALVAAFSLTAYPAGKPARLSPKEGLKPLHDLIGTWKAAGTPEGTPQEKQKGFWTETVTWSWKFKGDDAWFTVAFGKGKYFRNGELRYLPDTNRYQLTITTADSKTLVFEGELTKRELVLERVDEKTRETQRLVFSLVGEIRFTYRYEVKPAGRTQFSRVYLVGATRAGESLAGPGEKRPECILTGGAGTIPVTYKGQTYYVCCTGCRDEFLANPEQVIKEYLARKAKEAKKPAP
jgi:hypothetical protein